MAAITSTAGRSAPPSESRADATVKRSRDRSLSPALRVEIERRYEELLADGFAADKVEVRLALWLFQEHGVELTPTQVGRLLRGVENRDDDTGQIADCRYGDGERKTTPAVKIRLDDFARTVRAIVQSVANAQGLPEVVALQLLAEGCDYDEIARAMAISRRSVFRHLATMRVLLGERRLEKAISRAIRLGIVFIPQGDGCSQQELDGASLPPQKTPMLESTLPSRELAALEEESRRQEQETAQRDQAGVLASKGQAQTAAGFEDAIRAYRRASADVQAHPVTAVLKLLLSGQQVKDVALQMEVSSGTIHRRIQAAQTALKAQTTAQTIATAIRIGIVSPTT